jgi:hypothetical protein
MTTRSSSNVTAASKTMTASGNCKKYGRQPKASSSSSSSSVASLAFPWLGIVVMATVLAVVTVLFVSTTTSSSSIPGGDDENSLSWNRFLQEQTTQTTHAAVNAVKPIYNEEHDALFPLTSRDYIGFFLAILGLMVAAGGGIGGGGILVPIYILVLGFSPKHAIPLSNVTVFGGAMAKCVLDCVFIF